MSVASPAFFHDAFVSRFHGNVSTRGRDRAGDAVQKPIFVKARGLAQRGQLSWLTPLTRFRKAPGSRLDVEPG